jgi:hypothetical protein
MGGRGVPRAILEAVLELDDLGLNPGLTGAA